MFATQLGRDSIRESFAAVQEKMRIKNGVLGSNDLLKSKSLLATLLIDAINVSSPSKKKKIQNPIVFLLQYQ